MCAPRQPEEALRSHVYRRDIARQTHSRCRTRNMNHISSGGSSVFTRVIKFSLGAFLGYLIATICFLPNQMNIAPAVFGFADAKFPGLWQAFRLYSLQCRAA